MVPFIYFWLGIPVFILEEAREMADDFVKLTDERFPVEDFALQLAAFPGMDLETAEAAM